MSGALYLGGVMTGYHSCVGQTTLACAVSLARSVFLFYFILFYFLQGLQCTPPTQS